MLKFDKEDQWRNTETNFSFFDDWWNSLQGFTLLSERCLDDFKELGLSPKAHPTVEKWMKAAWNAALDEATNLQVNNLDKLRA